MRARRARAVAKAPSRPTTRRRKQFDVPAIRGLNVLEGAGISDLQGNLGTRNKDRGPSCSWDFHSPESMSTNMKMNGISFRTLSTRTTRFLPSQPLTEESFLSPFYVARARHSMNADAALDWEVRADAALKDGASHAQYTLRSHCVTCCLHRRPRKGVEVLSKVE